MSNTDTSIETNILREIGETVLCIKFWYKLYLLMSDYFFCNLNIEHWLLTTSFLLIIPFLFSWLKFCHLYPTVSFSSPAISRSSPLSFLPWVASLRLLCSHFLNKVQLYFCLLTMLLSSLSCVGGLYKSISFYSYVEMDGVGWFSPTVLSLRIYLPTVFQL